MNSLLNELLQLQQERRILKKELRLEGKRVNRIKTMYCLVAAHYYDLALLHSSLVINKTTWNEAERMADFINFASSGKYKPTIEEFMPHPEEYSNKSIDEYSIYEAYKNHPSIINKRLIDSFTRWYAKDRGNSIYIKLNYFFLESFFAYALGLHYKQLTHQEYSAFKEWLNTEDFPFTFHEKGVAKSFLIAKSKVLEIEAKIAEREGKSKRFTIS